MLNIKNHKGLLLVLFVAIGTNTIEAQETKPSNPSRANVVIIMADDLGYRDVGCYGCQDFATPNIDELASRGIRCTNGYVSHPYCSPSRAGLVSGSYQQSFGHEHNPPYDEANREIGIDPNTTLLPAIMQEAGYTTGLVGKWHLGAGEPFRPVPRGFTEFYGFLGGGHHYFEVQMDGKNYDSPIWRDRTATQDKLTYLTDDLTTEGLQFIERNKTNPFCLLMMYNAPHSPNHVTEEYLKRVETIKHPDRRDYAALVQGIDEGVKQIVAKLEELKLTQNTLVVFLSDNGGRAGVSDNRPLRGNKGWLNEGGIRVPFILSLPGKLAEGKVFDKPITALDLLPTAMSLGNVDVPNNCDGIDLMPFLTGKNPNAPHQTLYWRVCGGGGYAVRDGNWKLVHDVGMEAAELFDLSRDIGEDNDLAAKHPSKVKELKAKFDVWSHKMEAPRWTENHRANTTKERQRAQEANTRQSPMPWVPKS